MERQSPASLFQKSKTTSLIGHVFGAGRPNSAFQWMGLTGLTLGCVALIFQLKLLGVVMIIGLVAGAPFVLSALWSTRIGLWIMVVLAFFLSVINRLYEDIPMGIAIDAMIVILLYGVLYRSLYNKDWSAFSNPMSIAILIWGAYNIIEIANPWAASRAAWFYVIRPAVGYMMLFFITYESIQSKKDLFQLLFVIFGFSLFSAGWGIYQHFFGYFAWELNYVIRHDTLHLVFNHGRLRAIGSIGSPAQYGIIMACMSMFAAVMIPAMKKWPSKVFLIIVAFACLMAMVYSGTRSAFVIPPIFYFIYVFIARNKKLYISLAFAAGLLFVIATVPTSNYQIQRIQSIFKASEDASYQVRARNKAIIFPWILKHPIGGGLGSTGVWGNRFSPGTFLANFPPDSGLIRVAVELGWIGLIFFLNIYFRVIVTGSFRYWKMKDKQLKSVVAGMICMAVPMLVVEWGQEVIGVFPLSLLFWILIALMFRAIDLDGKTQQEGDKLLK